MINFRKDESMTGIDMPFGVVQVSYPKELDYENFNKMKEKELELIKAGRETYDRKEMFSQEPYFRYFRKFKKTYPVMAELESFMLKDRPFPTFNPINQVAFLTELKTHKLLGAHDVDMIEGDVIMYKATEKTPFVGLGERDVHTYLGDLTGRDDKGIIISMIAGADNRTCVSEKTRNVAYLFFSPEGTSETQMRQTMSQLKEYVGALSREANVEEIII